MEKLLSIFQELDEIAYGFGEGIAAAIISLNSSTIDKFWKRIEALAINNEQFAIGFGERIGELFPSIPEYVLDKAIMLANKNYEVAIPIGMYCSRHIQSTDTDLQNRVLKYARHCSVISVNMGTMLVESFSKLDAKLQKKLIKEAKSNKALARGLGFE